MREDRFGWRRDLQSDSRPSTGPLLDVAETCLTSLREILDDTLDYTKLSNRGGDVTAALASVDLDALLVDVVGRRADGWQRYTRTTAPTSLMSCSSRLYQPASAPKSTSAVSSVCSSTSSRTRSNSRRMERSLSLPLWTKRSPTANACSASSAATPAAGWSPVLCATTSTPPSSKRTPLRPEPAWELRSPTISFVAWEGLSGTSPP